MPADVAGLNSRWAVLGICIFLAAIIWAVFGQTAGFGFVNYDDSINVYENPVVTKGFSLKAIDWAFTHAQLANWIPLTTLSHVLDCQMFGLHAGGHHLVNVLWHTTGAVLLFLVLRQITGFLWRSAFVAAVFAIHPLRVESVAWVSERKDVLSGVFFLLTIAAYVRYARSPWSAGRYALVLLLFALGLMCKPMLVTLPFVLLLLDYWPLKRFESSIPKLPYLTVSRLILEKLPLLGLAAASCAATLFAQTQAVISFQQVSLPLRVSNALISCMTYVGKMFWPSGLAVFYPFPSNGGPLWEMILATVLLLSISAGVFVLRKTRPYLLVGWLWYLVMLAPVIGILQVGSQARADRYTCLPQIGLYLMLTWAAADLCVRWRHRRWVLGVCSTIILAALIFCAHAQTACWRDSESLWTHTLACTSDNPTAHDNLGTALLQKGEVNGAIAQYQLALQINPDDADAHYNLGTVQFQMGNVDEAMIHYRQALHINPNYVEAHDSLGNALFQLGSVDEAITQFQQELQINPDSTAAHNNLGNALLQKGSAAEAIFQYQKTLQINPDSVEANNNLAWVLATAPQAALRNGNEAVELARQANQLAGGENPNILRTLATAYAEAGRFADAQRSARKAMDLARAAGQTALMKQINSELMLYAAGLPYHEEGK